MQNLRATAQNSEKQKRSKLTSS